MSKYHKYSQDFKMECINLYKRKIPVTKIMKMKDVTHAILYRWIKYYKNSASFYEADNRSQLENELITARKELKQLRMENDILKQAAQIATKKK